MNSQTDHGQSLDPSKAQVYKRGRSTTARKLLPAGWLTVTIVMFGLLLSLFGNNANVSGEAEKLPAPAQIPGVVADPLGGPVNPGGVTGQSLWVKADVGVAVNASDQVEQWIDQSGSGNTATHLRASLPAHNNAITPSNAILRVPLGINFNPAVDFGGATGRSLKGNATTRWDATPVSIFSVASPEGLPAPGSVIAGVFSALNNWTTGGTGTAGIGLNINAAATSYALDGNGCGAAATTSPINEPRVVRGVYTNPLNTLGGSTWLNGVQEATGGSCATAATTLFEVGGRTAGDPAFDHRIFNGKIPEVVVYKRVLTAAEANRVDSYLAIKYGITLRQTPAPQNYTASDGTTAFWDAAVNTIYNNNITGIGRDDTSGLNQKQSRTVNLPGSGFRVTMGLGTLAIDNASNPNTFGADRDFLTWGDDGASGSFNTPITPPVGVAATVRTTRVWKVQETGTVPTVKVGIPANLGGGNTVYLVVSNDTIFDALDQYFPMTPLTVGISTYQTADFDFTTGQFFAFASIPAIPGGVAGPVAWQKANEGSPTGALWPDSSASGNDAAQPVAASQPLFVPGSDPGAVNFNPAFDFDGTNDFLDYSTTLNLGGLADFSSAIVVRPDAIAGVQVPFGATSAVADHYGLGLSDGGVFFTFVGGGGATCNAASTTTLTAGQPGIGSTVRGSSNMDVRVNGGGTGTAPCTTNFASVTRRLGARTTNFTNGAIPEFIHYDRALSANERQRIDSYLAVKYGITLDQTPPQNYVSSDGTVISWDAALNTIYNNNITGIGRDDVTALSQKQSRSVNLPAAGNMVTIGLGTIAADNESNLNAFAANNSFLTWGDDGASASFNTLITVPAGILATVRTTRVWKTQETGTVGTVKVGIAPNLGGGNVVYLVVSNDPIFDAGDQYIPMTPHAAGTAVYQAADFDFATGQFFAFATLPAIPGGVGTPVTWQKANDGAPSGSFWDDSSAGGNDATQPVAASQPTFVPGSDPGAVNFNPAFDFDGTDDFLDYPTTLNLGGLADFSSAIVVRPDAFGAAQVLFGDGLTGTNQYDWALSTTGAFQTFVGGAGGVCATLTTTTLPVGVPRLGSAVRESSNMAVRLNGGGTGTGACSANFTPNNRRLGARNGNFTNGAIPEFIHYDRALSANERQRVESYLAVKYGITQDQTAPTSYLASNSAVVWDSGINAIYNNDIAGIGRDDVSALNQKQSASVNAGNFLTIGHGSIAPDNESNPNAFPANLDFLIWGHDAAAVTFNVPVTGTGLVRMARVWKVQETAGVPFAPDFPASVDNVVVRVPASLFTNPFPTLIRSTDATFDLNDTLIPMTLNGTNYEATINYNDADFFTFAQFVQPTSANVSISGRVLTRDGRGLLNAKVTLTDLQGNSRTVTTNPFGYYRIDEVPTGETYVLTASAKRYRFDPRVATVKDEITDLDFIALE